MKTVGLCRVCGNAADKYASIFNTQGLQNKIETCLPIIVSRHSLLPDTICIDCKANVEQFYSFTKKCLENIVILEKQFDLKEEESCLKTNRKREQATFTQLNSHNLNLKSSENKEIQTEEDFTDIFYFKDKSTSFAQKLERVEKILLTDEKLVSYDIESESDEECEEARQEGKVELLNKVNSINLTEELVTPFVTLTKGFNPLNKNDYDMNYDYLKSGKEDEEEGSGDLITEIVVRKNLKRKAELPVSAYYSIHRHRQAKCFKFDYDSPNFSSTSNGNGMNENKNKNRLKKDCCSGSNKRKSREPMRRVVFSDEVTIKEDKMVAVVEEEGEREENLAIRRPQVCLLCEGQFASYVEFNGHMMDVHGIDMALILSNTNANFNSNSNDCDKRKKLPDLLKITNNNKGKENFGDFNHQQMETMEIGEEMRQQQQLEMEEIFNSSMNINMCNMEGNGHGQEQGGQFTFTCPFCPIILYSKTEIFSHLRLSHEKQSALMCGLCLTNFPSYVLLTTHLETCRSKHDLLGKYVCKICCYGDDNLKLVENHILVHDFVLAFCKKQVKMFDPTDYVQVNFKEGPSKAYNCSECQFVGGSFKEFSTHRRSEHQIFHCDLCNKFYGRNSHLWKHVNRLHKGHPSITCQLCYKTSASKYHLAQHFTKIHSAKAAKSGHIVLNSEEESFLSQKFEGFDFQSVKQSFLKQQLLDERNGTRDSSDIEENNLLFDEENESNEKAAPNSATGSGAFNSHLIPSSSSLHINLKKECVEQDFAVSAAAAAELRMVHGGGEGGGDLPKEIDSSSNLYTNIITNYTPPQNEGEYKCPKCLKGFHKKPLLKKHKKNCRPKLQKDLLTRCKTCSRIFKDRQSLAKHLVNYHSEYACEICDQKVQSKCEIVSHIRFSHPACHLKCHCGNYLRSTSDLQEHKADHRNSFVCQFCADTLPTKIKLKMHILSLHRKILSLSCGICLRLFETQHILRDHVRIAHGKELSQFTSCSVCGKNYGSKWKTYDHINKSHGKTFKACKSCLEVFDTEAELQAHVDSVHFNEPRPVPRGQEANNTSSSLHQQGAKDGSNEKINIKQEVSDSDYDDNSSDISINDELNEETEKNGQPQQQTQIKDEMRNVEVKSENEKAHSDFTDSISLLERRLLGKACEDIPPSSVSAELKRKSLIDDAYASQMNLNLHMNVKGNKVIGGKNNVATTTPKQKTNNKVTSNSNNINAKQSYDGEHNSSKRTVYVNSNDPSLCEICLRTWPAKKHLWQHYIRCHKTVAATVCGICLKTNEDYEELQKHLIKNHPTLLHGQGFGSNFICRICGRYHNASSKLKLHMAIHENFDWGLLEKYSSSYNRVLSSHHKTNGDQNSMLANNILNKNSSSNGYNSSSSSSTINASMSIICKEEKEQAEEECSSDDDDEEDSDEESEGEDEDADAGIKGREGEEEKTDSSSSDDSSMSDSLESQMLKNMLKEKRAILKRKQENPQEFRTGEEDGGKEDDYTSSDDDSSNGTTSSMSDVEEEDAEEEAHANVKSEYSSEDDEADAQEQEHEQEDEDEEGEASSQDASSTYQEKRQRRTFEDKDKDKSKEIDSAVRSITYEKLNANASQPEIIEEEENSIEEDYCDVTIPTPNLNPHEIQSAVDSIL